jgi:acetyl esterase/lipase
MRFEEYRKHDAISLAGLIAERQVSAEEVLEIAIARAEQVNPAINAIVHKASGSHRQNYRRRPSSPRKCAGQAVFVFIHGGAWRSGHSSQGFCRSGRDAPRRRRADFGFSADIINGGMCISVRSGAR